jgi:RNA polymerase sigma-70 factor (ECF subfamily)
LSSGNKERAPVQVSDYVFDDWVRQYQRLLFGIAYWWTGSRSDAEELTQEAFFQAYRSRSTLRDIEAVKGWLVGILRHCYAQTRRRDHSRAEVSLDHMANETGDKDLFGPDVLALHQSLARLDEIHRIPVVMFYFHDLSYREISEALDLPIGTVMSRLSRARKLLHLSLTTPHRLTLVKKVKVR